MNLKQLYNRTPGATGAILANVQNGYNSDIVTAILNATTPAADQVKNIAQTFRGATDRDTARNIFDFLKNNITYLEDQGRQVIKLPARLLLDGSGDCKSFALFTAAILKNLNIPASLRFTSYTAEPQPSHVYVVTAAGIIDAVYTHFDAEKKYQSKKDYPMQIVTINGLGTTIALAIPRGAFLTLLRLNVRDLARIMDAANRKNAQNVKARWNKLGGNYTELGKAIQAGKGKRRIFGIGSVAAILESAAIIISALKDIILMGKGQVQTETGETLPDPFGGQAPPDTNQPGQGTGGGVSQTTVLIGAAILAAVLIFKK